MALFPRRVELSVGNSTESLIFGGLMVSWGIERTSDSRQPSGRVSLYNLKADSEARLKERYTDVRLSAGYSDRFGLLLAGQILRVHRERQGLDRVAHVEIGGMIASGGDPSRGRNATVDVSFAGGVGLETIVHYLASRMGMVVEPVAHVAGLNVFVTGYASGVGPARVHLDRLLEPYGMSWYEDQGVVRFRRSGMAGISKRGVLVVSEANGMIGTPGVLDEGLRLKTLIDHRVELDGFVRVVSAFHGPAVAGLWKVTRLFHFGDSREGEAATEFDVVPAA